jgi:hypothetical protein
LAQVAQVALQIHLVLLEITQYFRPLHQLAVVLVQNKHRLAVLGVAEAGLDGRVVLVALVLQIKDSLVQLVLVQQTLAVLVVARVQLVIMLVQEVLELQTQ